MRMGEIQGVLDWMTGKKEDLVETEKIQGDLIREEKSAD